MIAILESELVHSMFVYFKTRNMQAILAGSNKCNAQDIATLTLHNLLLKGKQLYIRKYAVLEIRVSPCHVECKNIRQVI